MKGPSFRDFSELTLYGRSTIYTCRHAARMLLATRVPARKSLCRNTLGAAFADRPRGSAVFARATKGTARPSPSPITQAKPKLPRAIEPRRRRRKKFTHRLDTKA